MKFHRFSLILISCMLMIPFPAAGPASAQSPRTVMVLPFNIYSEKDLSFLQNGVRDMLSSRLNQEGKVRVLDRNVTDEVTAAIDDISETVAANLGEEAGVDFVVFGSLTVFGEHISTDARIYHVGEKKAALTFSETGANPGDVIAHINRFASRVNTEVFERKPAPETEASEPAAEPADSRQHPETLWNRTGGKAAGSIGEAPPEEASSALGGSWKSRHFDAEIRRISLGDVDGDGQTEVALADEGNVWVHRFVNERFIKVGEIPGDANRKILSVDAADINENGRAEIFVTQIHPESHFLDSYVLEWEDGRFSRIVTGSEWYYTVIDIPGRGKVLMGQQRNKRNLFSGGVEEMKWTGSGYEPDLPQALPPWTHVYGFNYGDFTDRNAGMTVAFTENDYLRVLGPEGNQEWESSEAYGGGSVYLEFPMESASRIGEHKEMGRHYLPLRILTRDIDGNGKSEVIVARNRDAAGRLFSRVRIYKGGHIECLEWNDFGMTTRWKTPEISGHISDYAIGDLNNDGKIELAFSVIQKISSVLGSPRSYIGAFEISQP